MPTVTVASSSGIVTLTYDSTVNGSQFAKFASSVTSLFNGTPSSNIQSFSGGPFTNEPVTGTIGYIDPGSFVLSPQTQAIVVENNTSNTITGGGNPALTILSGTGALTYYGPSGNTTVVAGGGGNMIDFQSGLANAAYLNSGSNTVYSESGNASILTGTGNNAVVITSGTANIYSTGTDTIYGGSASDTVNVVSPTPGGPAASHDVFIGGSGRALFVNGNATSTVFGGSAASDTFYGGTGGGIFVGGTGGNNAIVGQGGSALIYGGGTGDTLYAGGSVANTIVAGAGNETLTGVGSTGNNLFYAANGNDAIAGGGGNDTMVGGSGHATMTGGAGADLFSFANGMAGTNTITDFSAAQGDKVTLTGFGSGAVSAALGSASIANGAETLTLSDGTKITFSGVTNLTSSNFS